jgi:AraC family transcriptional regulator, ethanolamine operon transcriptional activator
VHYILNPKVDPESASLRTQGKTGVDTLAGTPSWAVRKLEFDDSDELAALVSHTNADLKRLSKAPGKSKLILGNVSDLIFQAYDTPGYHHMRGGVAAGTVVMEFDVGSSGQRRLGGQALGPDDVAVGLGGAEFDFLSAEHNKDVEFSVPESLVVAALRHREPASEALIGGASLGVVTGCDLWVARIRELASALLAPCGEPAGPRSHEHVHADVSDTLVAMLLLPWRRSDAAAFRLVHYQRRPIVHRVIDFMRANLSEPLMMHDLCRAARASERAVEYAFRDVCGVGPKQYLRILRLHQVRRDLRALPAAVATVTSIAHLYGFWHMGHFAKAYRQLFGETPRQTRQKYT